MRNMEIEIRQVETDSVISLTGRIDASTAPQLEEQLNNLMKEGKVRIIINFKGIDYISSGGLRVLLMFTKGLKEKGGYLRFCRLDANVYKIFKLTGFTSIFEIYETEEEALAGGSRQ